MRHEHRRGHFISRTVKSIWKCRTPAKASPIEIARFFPRASTGSRWFLIQLRCPFDNKGSRWFQQAVNISCNLPEHLSDKDTSCEDSATAIGRPQALTSRVTDNQSKLSRASGWIKGEFANLVIVSTLSWCNGVPYSVLSTVLLVNTSCDLIILWAIKERHAGSRGCRRGVALLQLWIHSLSSPHGRDHS